MLRYCLLSLVVYVGACHTPRQVPTPATASPMEDQLVAAFDTFYANAFSDAYRDRFFEVRDSLKEVLRKGLQTIPLDQELPQLQEKVSIRQSASGRLRTFSWDERSGGTWHDMAVVAQFKGTDQQLYTQALDPKVSWEEDGPPPPPDIVVYRVYDMSVKPPTFLLIGWGTYGSGHHHEAARLMRLEQDTLVDVPQAFGEDDFLVVMASRRDSIGLVFDPASLRLRHRVFERDEEIGFMRSTGQEAQWVFKEGRFERVE